MSPEQSEERAKAVVDAAERAASEILADATREAQLRVAEARERAEAIGRERVEMMSALSDSLLEQATTVKRQADVVIEALDQVIATLAEERDRPARPQAEPRRPARPSPPAMATRPALSRPPVAARPPAPPPRQAPPPPPAAPPRPQPAPQPAAPDSEVRRRALEAVRARMAHSAEPQAPSPPQAPAPAPAPTPRSQDPQRPARKPVSEGTAEGARILATQMAVAGSTRAEILVRLRKEFGIEDPEPIVDGVVGGPEPR